MNIPSVSRLARVPEIYTGVSRRRVVDHSKGIVVRQLRQPCKLQGISGLARFGIAVLTRYTVKEVRHVEHVKPRMLLYDVSGMRAFGLLSRELLFTFKKRR